MKPGGSHGGRGTPAEKASAGCAGTGGPTSTGEAGAGEAGPAGTVEAGSARSACALSLAKEPAAGAAMKTDRSGGSVTVSSPLKTKFMKNSVQRRTFMSGA
jgi:hypothetical protein